MDYTLLPTEGWGKLLTNFQGFSESGLKQYFGEEINTNKGKRFFQEGYIEKPLFHPSPFTGLPMYAFQVRCLPSMRKGSYKVTILLQNEIVTKATCGCPAGLGAKCHHIAALLYFLIAVTDLRLKTLPENKTCTDQLCKWIQPGAGKRKGKPLSELDFRKTCKIGKRGKYSDRVKRISNHYDPRPDYHQKPSKDLTNILFNRLKEINPNCAFIKHYNSIEDSAQSEPLLQSVLTVENDFQAPNVTDRIEDTCISGQQTDNSVLHGEIVSSETTCIISTPINSPSFQDHVEIYISEHYPELSAEQVAEIEENTLGQADNPLWFTARKNKLTSSKFGSICKLSVSPNNILKTLLYAKPFSSNATKHGQKYEADAIVAYTLMKERQEELVTVRTCGLFVMASNPYMAASPDGIVENNNTHELGLLEVKCPFSKFGSTISDALQSKSFYLQQSENGITLNRCHIYYYQIQSCLAIAGCSWCDFFVWMGNDFNQQFCERIYFDKAFWDDTLFPSAVHFLKFAFIPELILRRVEKGEQLYTGEQYIPFKNCSMKKKHHSEKSKLPVSV